MLDLRLKAKKDQALDHLALRIHHSPMMVSVVGFTIGLGSIGAIGMGNYRLGVYLWWMNRLVDGLDGAVARKQHKESDWGGLMDVVFDLIIYAGILIALVWNREPAVIMLGLILMGLFYVNIGQLFLGSAILEKRKLGKKKLTATQLPASLIEGTETIVLYSLMILFPGALVMWISLFMVGMVVTIGQRMWWLGKVLGNSNE